MPKDVFTLYQAAAPNEVASDATDLREDAVFGRTYSRDGADRARVKRYARAQELLDLENHYRLVEGKAGRRAPDDRHFIPVDFPGMFGRLMRHYVFGREFKLQPTNAAGAENLRQLVSGMNLVPALRRAAEFGQAYGDVVFKVTTEEVEDDTGDMVPFPALKFVEPWHFFPTLDPLDAEKVKGVTLAWVLAKPDHLTVGTDMLVLLEEHEPGLVRWSVHSWDGEKLGDDLGEAVLRDVMEDPEFQSEVETGINEIPVVHVGFNRRAGRLWGQSELDRIRRIVLALENRLAQLDEVLEKHARPKLIVGPGVLDEDGRANLADFDVIEVEPAVMEAAIKPEYLTWDPQIQAIVKQVEKLEEYLFMTTETSPASFGLERDGSQVESARALKFKAHRTVNKVNDYRDEWIPALRSIVRLGFKLWNVALEDEGESEVTRTGVRVAWGDAIVEDDTQKAQDLALLRGAGLVSRKRGVMEQWELTEEEADAEVREILQDQVDETAAMQLSGRSGEGEGLGPEAANADTEEQPPAEGEAPPEGFTPADEA